MVNITLTSQERDIFIGVLGNYISELHMEIRDTEKWEFKSKLKEEQVVLKRVLNDLRTDQAMEYQNLELGKHKTGNE